MARSQRQRTQPEQMTLDDWAQVLETKGKGEPTSEPTGEPKPVAALADALAPRLAEELARRIPSGVSEVSTPVHLLTLDDLVAELPPAKPPKT